MPFCRSPISNTGGNPSVFCAKLRRTGAVALLVAVAGGTILPDLAGFPGSGAEIGTHISNHPGCGGCLVRPFSPRRKSGSARSVFSDAFSNLRIRNSGRSCFFWRHDFASARPSPKLFRQPACSASLRACFCSVQICLIWMWHICCLASEPRQRSGPATRPGQPGLSPVVRCSA